MVCPSHPRRPSEVLVLPQCEPTVAPLKLTLLVLLSAYRTFVSMQTGNTIFIGLGASPNDQNQPYGWLKSLMSLITFLAGYVHTSKIYLLSLLFYFRCPPISPSKIPIDLNSIQLTSVPPHLSL